MQQYDYTSEAVFTIEYNDDEYDLFIKGWHNHNTDKWHYEIHDIKIGNTSFQYITELYNEATDYLKTNIDYVEEKLEDNRKKTFKEE